MGLTVNGSTKIAEISWRSSTAHFAWNAPIGVAGCRPYLRKLGIALDTVEWFLYLIPIEMAQDHMHRIIHEFYE
jgi:hypothetical protein